jgi:hypothetical protein
MTMHLHHPSLSLNGKKKGKQKFRNAAEAQRARELNESWKDLQKRWGIEQEERKRKRALTAPVWTDPTPIRRDSNDPRPKSLNTWTTGAVSSKPSPQYSGTKILGIGTLHKSNAVPVFSNEEAIDISRMRRG